MLNLKNPLRHFIPQGFIGKNSLFLNWFSGDVMLRGLIKKKRNEDSHAGENVCRKYTIFHHKIQHSLYLRTPSITHMLD
jgi:hypothetical protein